MVSWRDAIVWCNALTEYYNARYGTNYDCVYYTDAGYTRLLKIATNNHSLNTTSGSEDQPYIKALAPGNTAMTNCAAKGFRLPTSLEWELAARWSTDSTNTVLGFANPYFTKGNSASGAVAGCDNEEATQAVAWYGIISNCSTHPVGQKAANDLGIYDMSGNVWEWCFDKNEDGRIIRGGSWGDDQYGQQVGGVYGVYPVYGQFYLGFRPARTK